MAQKNLKSPTFGTTKLPFTVDNAGTSMLKFTSGRVNVWGSPPGLTTVTWTVSPAYTVRLFGENAQTSPSCSRPPYGLHYGRLSLTRRDVRPDANTQLGPETAVLGCRASGREMV